jgi:hypothetical protein
MGTAEIRTAVVSHFQTLGLVDYLYKMFASYMTGYGKQPQSIVQETMSLYIASSTSLELEVTNAMADSTSPYQMFIDSFYALKVLSPNFANVLLQHAKVNKRYDIGRLLIKTVCCKA